MTTRETQMDDQIPPGLSGWAYYFTVGFFSSLAGIAALLRSRRRLSVRHVVAAWLTALLAGLAVGGWLAEHLEPAPGKLIAVSILAGIGGADLLFALAGAVQARLVAGLNGERDEKGQPGGG